MEILISTGLTGFCNMLEHVDKAPTRLASTLERARGLAVSS